MKRPDAAATALATLADRGRARNARPGIVRLPIDRAFTIKGFGTVVTLLVGLPFIRTSTGHGTAFDIAGKGVANTGAMQNAFALACKMGMTQRNIRVAA